MGHERNYLNLYLPTYTKPSKTYNMQLAFACYLLLAWYFLPVVLNPQTTVSCVSRDNFFFLSNLVPEGSNY